MANASRGFDQIDESIAKMAAAPSNHKDREKHK
jgi:hypothetical protein